MTLAEAKSTLDAALKLLGSLAALLGVLANALPKGWRLTYWLARVATDGRGVVAHHHAAAAPAERDHVSVEYKP